MTKSQKICKEYQEINNKTMKININNVAIIKKLCS